MEEKLFSAAIVQSTVDSETKEVIGVPYGLKLEKGDIISVTFPFCQEPEYFKVLNFTEGLNANDIDFIKALAESYINMPFTVYKKQQAIA